MNMENSVFGSKSDLLVWLASHFCSLSLLLLIFFLVKDKPAYMRTATYSKLLNLATAARLEFGLEMPSILNNVEKVRFK